MDFRQRIFQYRSYTPIPFLIAMVALARPTAASMLLGMPLVAGGEFLRLWGVAIAGSETRTTGPVGGTFLITTGPFAYVRNPLYLGNMLMYFGVGVMSNVPVLAVVALVFFLLQYSLIVSLEEEYLVRTFGPAYAEYCRSVDRFLPRFSRYGSGSQEQPALEWKRGMRSERRTLQAIGLTTVVLVVLWIVRG
jgi:protein-S-isoprenylcysteine O-methyltransferase Ste14